MAKKKLHPVLRIIRILVLLYGGLALFACTMADRMIFMPPPTGYIANGKGLVRFQTSADETITALHFPAKPGNPTVIYSHGNAEDISGSIPLYQDWRKRGWGVLAYDYPGYGHSSGKPSEPSSERSIAAAWSYLTEQSGIDPQQIVIVGRSVGSGPSVWLASKEQAAALVLISPFTSAFAVRPPAHRFLPGDRFPNLKRISNIETPLFVIHGMADGLIPPSHGQALVEASPAELKRFKGIETASHNNLFRLAQKDLLDEIETFYAEATD